jgi:(+)-trans-carveol dehydrogenase
MGRLDGKIAMITGAARGQGRSHAVRFAREGAQIVACDICAPLPGVAYEASTTDDLDETVRLVEELDQRCVAMVADARDAKQMQAVVDAAIANFGRIDVLHVNHGITIIAPWDKTTDEIWDTTIDVMLNGAWRTVRAVIPHMIEQGGGSIIFTTSAATQTTYYGLTHYTVAKSGIAALMKTLSAELAPHSIRVNSIGPGAVGTVMSLNQPAVEMFAGRKGATLDEVKPVFQALNLLPTPWLEPVDISNAALFLASDEARYVTGIDMMVDAGACNQPPGIPPSASEELGQLRAQVAARQ